MRIWGVIFSSLRLESSFRRKDKGLAHVTLPTLLGFVSLNPLALCRLPSSSQDTADRLFTTSSL